ncbi:MAG: hypothetical protein L0207_04850 [Chlamydiae bacterium]|nr:hypothetical protein [Chlamydiota bacterium]
MANKIMNFSANEQDVVSFCEKQLNPTEADKIIKEGKGLSNSAEIEKNLKESRYIPVLKALWSEKDKEKRLEWLKSHSKLHAPLMFEQAIAEFVNYPTVEAIHSISMPLIKAATFRVLQDSKCSRDPSVFNGDAPGRVAETYMKILENQVQKHLKKSLADIGNEKKEMLASFIRSKLIEIIKQSKEKELPDPSWIGWHGMSVFIDGKIEMHPASDYKKIRDQAADEMLGKLKA